MIVVSIYMLLDMDRLSARVDRRFPPTPTSGSLVGNMEQAVASYVRGQFLLSLIIGGSVALGLWILGLVGLFPGGGKYALAFGAWAAITELIPYIGPWLGAFPAVVYALVQHPISALWVALLFLGIQQLEGHVIVPKVMGHSLRLHPLLVIFGLLAGGEIYGLPGHPRRAAAARRRAGGVGVLRRPRRARALAGGGASAGRGRRGGPGARAAGRARRAVTAPLVRAQQVARRYGEIEALAPTDLELYGGEIVALVGPNGAGKSTLLAIAAGSLEPTQGTVEVHARVGWVPQRPAHYARLSARENLELFARLEGDADPAGAAERLLDRFTLPKEQRPSGELSVGNRQRLNVALSLLGDPRVLLLDEPTASLDPGQRRRVWDVVDELRGEGGAICFSTQNVEEIGEHADRVVVLQNGRVMFAGPASGYAAVADEVFG